MSANVFERAAKAFADWRHDRVWKDLPKPVYSIVRMVGQDIGDARHELHMSPALREGTGALEVSVGVIYSNLGSALEDIIRNGEPTRLHPDEDGSWVAVRHIETGDIFEAHPNVKAEKFIAECEYTCGFSYGPDDKKTVWQKATQHGNECLYGGPVIRNVTDPAPSWVNDPLMDPNADIPRETPRKDDHE